MATRELVEDTIKKLTAYIQAVPDHYETTTMRLMQQFMPEEQLYEFSSDDLMEINDRFYAEAEKIGYKLELDKYNSYVMALNFNKAFIIHKHPEDEEESECSCGHHHHHHDDHECECEHDHHHE